MSSARFAQRVVRHAGVPIIELPVFLCPGILKIAIQRQPRCYSKQTRPFSRSSNNWQTTTLLSDDLSNPKGVPTIVRRSLPLQCSGCGAFSQAVDKDGAGFYALTRKTVRSYLYSGSSLKPSAEDEIIKVALEKAGLAAAGLNIESPVAQAQEVEPIMCDRCHNLKHHEIGVSIRHPSIKSLEDTICETPYKFNHVYHILDAADFPMSLVPGIHKLLNLTPQRSHNRRSKTEKFSHNKKADISFIITRSDLLAPVKEQVDSMMPYLRSVLRDALGRAGRDARLGNIRCVSAKKAWWTKELREEIWRRGGGGWMVGKVNVGKSQLFHDVFPKGRKDWDCQLQKKVPATASETLEAMEQTSHETNNPSPPGKKQATELPDPSSLLPPAPPETDYPPMPLVSTLPGTTASPIRHSFGNGKGELVDLPGLSRGDLELHVQPEYRSDLVMRSRVCPEQKVIKPGQSLLLGGFIRITPTTPDVIMLAYSFTPIHPHLTRTEKAIGIQGQTRESNVVNISMPGTGEKIASAGTFHLKWDVTRQRAGPLTSRDGIGIKPERLPYRILATDILIEGCGWVEIVAQVSKKRERIMKSMKLEEENEDRWDFEPVKGQITDPDWPAVEVFSPEGKFIATRRPMNAWMYVARKPTNRRLQGRPRRSMKGAKRTEKNRRATEASL